MARIACVRLFPRAALAALLLCLATPASATCTSAAAAATAEAETAARGVMDDFLMAFNARDEAAWAETLLYPHVRFASGTVAVFPDAAAFVADRDLDDFAADTGWDRSTWDDMRVVQASPEKVHIAVTFTRYDGDGEAMASYESLYVIERQDGRWGVRARSSFAP
jgi:hypothetical protein